MDAQNIREAVKDAAESIRKSPPIRRRENTAYALVVKSAYDAIQKLREEGYSYDVICETFSEKGVLHPGANPKNLCSAFLRETKRRDKRIVKAAEPTRPEVKKAGESGFKYSSLAAGGQTSPQKTPPPDEFTLVVNPDNTFNISPSLTESEIKAIEEHKKKMNLPSYDTGRGFKITKNTDGSFDYD